MTMLLSGRSVGAAEASGWLVDVAAPLPEALAAAWSIASGDAATPRRPLQEGPINVQTEVAGLPPGNAGTELARGAIAACVRASCSVPLAEAVDMQSRHSADFMVTQACRRGRVGGEYQRTMAV